jgi:hypothetical protein
VQVSRLQTRSQQRIHYQQEQGRMQVSCSRLQTRSQRQIRYQGQGRAQEQGGVCLCWNCPTSCRGTLEDRVGDQPAMELLYHCDGPLDLD